MSHLFDIRAARARGLVFALLCLPPAAAGRMAASSVMTCSPEASQRTAPLVCHGDRQASDADSNGSARGSWQIVPVTFGVQAHERHRKL